MSVCLTNMVLNSIKPISDEESLELANKVLVRSFGLLQLSLNDYLKGEGAGGDAPD